MRNAEYIDKLIAEIGKLKEVVEHYQHSPTDGANRAYLKSLETLLQEYDRLHPQTIQVESVLIRDKRGYKNAPPQMQGCVTLFDNLSGCNITVIDNVLNVEIQ